MRFLILAFGLLLAAPDVFALQFVAYGDTRTNNGIHQNVIDAIAKRNPEVIIHSGDLWDGYTPAQFKDILTKNPNIASLLDKNLFLVARGNHESLSELLAFKPTLVRNGKELYSFTQGNCFFVSLGMNPATTAAIAFLEQELQSDAAKAATWKFFFSHYPVRSTGEHGSTGISAVEKLCDKYGVNVVFNGHDHIYERSHQLYNGQIIDKGNDLVSEKGTVYIVSGGGGAPLYPTGVAAWSHFAKSANHFLDITADASKLDIKALSPSGTVLDAFTLKKATVSIAAGTPADPGPALLVELAQPGKLAILSFPAVQGEMASLEIRSPDGSLQAREVLSSGQRSQGWSYSGRPQGQYLAVFENGPLRLSRKFALAP